LLTEELVVGAVVVVGAVLLELPTVCVTVWVTVTGVCVTVVGAQTALEDALDSVAAVELLGLLVEGIEVVGVTEVPE
jgi:hypothetical protein